MQRIDSAFVKSLARSRGASLVGIASVDRFEGAPRGHAPEDFVSAARSVIVVGLRLLPSVVNWPRLFERSAIVTGDVRMAVAQDHVYMRCGYHVVNDRLNDIAMDVAYALQDAGHETMFFPATYSHDADIMRAIPGFFAPFSHRHAAVRAGLGGFGLNNLVVTPEYGPRIRFNSIITVGDLEPDPLLEEAVCLGESCRLCVSGCAPGAISPLVASPDIKRNLDMPSVVDKETCLNRHGELGCIGACLRVCPVGS